MKTIGLIGGMSWQSSIEYYRIINERVAERLGGLHSARCLLLSLDFDEVERVQARGAWDQAELLMVEAARGLERAGAELLAICTNTMHKTADAVQSAVDIPLLHIADATARSVQAAGCRKVGLLATRFTMEEDFYVGRLSERHGLGVAVPNEAERGMVHAVIYEELCRGVISADSRESLKAVIQHLVDAGCEGIILGCTEIGLLIKAADSPVPLFDTAIIHARAAADFALGQTNQRD